MKSALRLLASLALVATALVARSAAALHLRLRRRDLGIHEDRGGASPATRSMLAPGTYGFLRLPTAAGDRAEPHLHSRPGPHPSRHRGLVVGFREVSVDNAPGSKAQATACAQAAGSFRGRPASTSTGSSSRTAMPRTTTRLAFVTTTVRRTFSSRAPSSSRNRQRLDRRDDRLRQRHPEPSDRRVERVLRKRKPRGLCVEPHPQHLQLRRQFHAALFVPARSHAQGQNLTAAPITSTIEYNWLSRASRATRAISAIQRRLRE